MILISSQEETRKEAITVHPILALRGKLRQNVGEVPRSGAAGAGGKGRGREDSREEMAGGCRPQEVRLGEPKAGSGPRSEGAGSP